MPKSCVTISLREQRALERKVHLAGKGFVKEKLARPLIDAWVKWVKTILRRIDHRVYNDKGVSLPTLTWRSFRAGHGNTFHHCPEHRWLRTDKGVPGTLQPLLPFLELMVPVDRQGGREAGFQLQTFGFAGRGVGDFLPEENDFGTFRERE